MKKFKIGVAYEGSIYLLIEAEMQENYKNYIESRTDPQTFSKDDPLLTFEQFAESLEANQE